MKKISILGISALLFLACETQKTASEVPQTSEPLTQTDWQKSITANELQDLLYTYASDDFQGREAGTNGEDLATNFLRNFYKKHNIKAAPNTQDYYQIIPKGTFNRVPNDCQNVVAYIEGTDKKEEVIVLSAHLDHLGVHDGKISNGADDDGSGNVALLEIAEAFQEAANNGQRPRRSVVFIHVTAEEKGLLGSKYYADHPLFPMENTIANLNVDMIGRQDDAHKDDENYVYLIGSDMLSDELHQISEAVNQSCCNISLDYTYNAKNDPNRYYYRSDHYNFAKNNVPVIFYFNGVHQDYHQPTDTPDKINYELLAKRAQLIFATAWELANREERPKLKE